MSLIRSFSIFGAVLLCGPLAAQSWIQEGPATAPSNRRAGGACYDPINGVVLNYGALLTPTAISSDNWTWNGLNWALIAPATTPPPRWGHRMIFDSARQRIVTFGGRSPTVTAVAADTWEWDGVNWQQVFPSASPTPRAFYAMSYDERRGRTVIFGSQSTTQGAQVWEYDGTTWILAAPATPVASRESPMMVYDKGRGVTVMFGGWNGLTATMYGDTWEWDGIDWRGVTTANAPAPRYRASMVYDTVRHRVVMYGGFSGGAAATDTWEYDGSNWTQVTVFSGNVSSTEAISAFHEGLGTFVTLGGSGPGGVNNQTWSYTGVPSPSFALYGRGAPGGLGVPILSSTTPSIGQTLILSASSIPAAVTVSFIGLGLSNTDWVGRPLPSDLTPDGLTGCTLETSLDLLIQWPIVGGLLGFPIGLPPDPALINAIFFSQILVGDSSAPNGICSMTRGGRVIIGP